MKARMPAAGVPAYEPPFHDPANPLRMDRHTGTCHICRFLLAPITYCEMCEHWLCENCRAAWQRRGMAAVTQVVSVILDSLKLGGSTGPCCGPREA